MRALTVIAVDGSNKPAIWAKRQINSLMHLGVDVETYVFQNRRSLRGLIAGGLTLRHKAHKFDADLVHVHYGAAQGLIAVLFAGKPVVISFCGSDLFGNYDAYGRKTWSGYLSMVLSQMAALGCRRAIAKSDGLRNALWVSFSRHKCEVIPNGVDLSKFKPIPRARARAALGWKHDDAVVLFMDRKGAWVKDPGLAHAAYREAKRTVSSLRMYVVENEPPEKMPLFYNAADVLLITSRHEGSSNTVKEALACNLPVVATPCGDIPERLRGISGCYVCGRDGHELGQRLSEVASSRERINGRGHIQELAQEHVAARIKACYEEALSNNGARWLFECRNK